MMRYRVSIVALNIAVVLLVFFKRSLVLQACAVLLGIVVVWVLPRFCCGSGASGSVSHGVSKDAAGKFGRSMALVFAVAVLCGLVYSCNCFRSSRPFSIGEINRISGTLCQDSSVTRKGGCLYSVKAQVIGNGFIESTASRIVSVYVRDSDWRGAYGDAVEFFGVSESDGDGLYFADSCRLVRRSSVSDLRVRALAFAERRIMTMTNRFRSDEDASARGMAMKLLFGRNAVEFDDDVRESIGATGLAFVFALSGMHLNVVAAIILRISRRRLTMVKSNIVTVLIVSAYFMIASRSASFVRAYLMFLLSHVFSDDRKLLLPLGFLLQNVLFPMTVVSISFDYSYLATCGIMLLGRPVSVAFAMRVPKILAGYFSFGFCAVSFSAAVGLAESSGFMPMSLLIGPVAGAMASVFMVLAACFVAFPRSAVLSFLARYLHLIMKRILVFCAGLSADLGLSGFLCVVLIVAMFLSLAVLSKSKAKPFDGLQGYS